MRATTRAPAAGDTAVGAGVSVLSSILFMSGPRAGTSARSRYIEIAHNPAARPRASRLTGWLLRRQAQFFVRLSVLEGKTKPMDDHFKQLLLLGREHYSKREYDKAEPLLRQVA